ncbi:MAG: imidazole glycerol phosphate synthase subunit HisH [Lachnospirales bacterium]
MIGILDYGFGNLPNVKKALDFINVKSEIFSKKENINTYDKIILPGVGAFADATKKIRNEEIDKYLKEFVANEKDILGICLGMQLLFDRSYENGEYKGLGLLEGEIVRLPNNVKVPHMGWNLLNIKNNNGILKNLEDGYCYFVHSYYLETNANIVSGTTLYSKEINVCVEKNNIFGCQFHPEKSGETGLKILKNFADN